MNPFHIFPPYFSKIHSRQPQDIEGSCKYTEQAVTASQQQEVLHFGG